MSSRAPGQPGTPLRQRIVTLAGRVDDDSRIGADLVDIAVLSTGRVAAVSYASVTSGYQGAYATVAASSEIAVAVDAAQYTDNAGPCLDALTGNDPIAVPDIAATMAWPAFREVAFGLGLRSSLSIPLFAGQGTAIAALNLYAHDPDAMKVLTTAVWAVFDTDTPVDRRVDDLDAGGNELVAGLAGAFTVRARIQQAIGLLMSRSGGSLTHAFTALCARAAETNSTLTETATRLIDDNLR